MQCFFGGQFFGSCPCYRGKTMVHEWAKLRWGVYEEHGYPGDTKFPIFYLKSTWTVNGPENRVVINLCLNSDPVGYEQVKIL